MWGSKEHKREGKKKPKQPKKKSYVMAKFKGK